MYRVVSQSIYPVALQMDDCLATIDRPSNERKWCHGLVCGRGSYGSFMSRFIGHKAAPSPHQTAIISNYSVYTKSSLQFSALLLNSFQRPSCETAFPQNYFVWIDWKRKRIRNSQTIDKATGITGCISLRYILLIYCYVLTMFLLFIYTYIYIYFLALLAIYITVV